MIPFPSLERRLVDHFAGPNILADGQSVHVGTRPTDQDWIAVVRLDGIKSRNEATWLAKRVHEDLIAHLSFSNQEQVPVDAVQVEVGRPAGSIHFSMAVFVILATLDEAQDFASFLRAYADPT